MIDDNIIEAFVKEYDMLLKEQFIPNKRDYCVYSVFNRGNLVEFKDFGDDKPVFSVFKKKYDGLGYQVVEDFDKTRFYEDQRNLRADNGKKIVEFFDKFREYLFEASGFENDILFEKAKKYASVIEDDLRTIAEVYVDLSEAFIGYSQTA